MSSFLTQGDFPRGDTAEDGYHGVSPVAAFSPQNSYGMERHHCPALWVPSAHLSMLIINPVVVAEFQM